jgi:hypothetical protein
MWLCSLGGIVIYGQLYLFSRGNLEFEEDEKGKVYWRWYLHAQPLPEVPMGSDGKPVDQEKYDEVKEQKELRSHAYKMLLYAHIRSPLYTLLIIYQLSRSIHGPNARDFDHALGRA